MPFACEPVIRGRWLPLPLVLCLWESRNMQTSRNCSFTAGRINFLFGCLSVFNTASQFSHLQLLLFRLAVKQNHLSWPRAGSPPSQDKPSTLGTTSYPRPARIISFTFNFAGKHVSKNLVLSRFTTWEIVAHQGRSVSLRNQDVVSISYATALSIVQKWPFFFCERT